MDLTSSDAGLARGQAVQGSGETAQRLNNVGVGYMNQQRFAQALEQFEAALARDSDLLVAQLNRGIALLHLQRFDGARDAFADVTRRAPNDVRGWYNIGLLEKTLGNAEPALEAFNKAATLDPLQADTYYFVGAMLAQLQRHEEAIAPLAKALELNPYHASAEFALARAYQRLGRAEQAQTRLQRFQRMVQEKVATPMGLVYGDQGPYSLTQPAPAVARQPEAIPVTFADVTRDAGLMLDGAAPPVGVGLLGPGACALDANADRLPDLLLLTGRPERPLTLFVGVSPGRFADRTQVSGLDAIRGVAIACAAGDYDNDRRIDLAVSLEDRVALLRQTDRGRFEDVAKQAGIVVGRLPVGLTFVDHDHDGDLDLFVARFPAPAGDGWPFGVRDGAAGPASVLLRNNGNGAFTDVSTEVGLGSVSSALAAVLTDANNDRAVDLIVTGPAPALFLNSREGAFTRTRPWGTPAPTAGVVVVDFDKDGWMDVALTHWSAPALTLWRNVDGQRFERVDLPRTGWTRAWGLAACDYDNDGWIDLVAAGEDGRSTIGMLRNEGTRGFVDRTAATGLSDVTLNSPRALLCFDADSDGDADLLTTQNGAGPRLLRNEGGNRHRWMRAALSGVNDNRSAIGTKVEVFAGPLWQKWEIQGSSGYLGQAPLPLFAGLGSQTEAEILRLLWPTGVVQDEVRLATNTMHAVDQIDRRGSSCPVLFTWNGSRFEFVTDAIGPGILGHWVAPGQRNVPDPTEYIKIEGRQLRPNDGLLSVRFAEPMEEVIYLDEVRLIAVDHPSDVEINPNEYFASAPPFPEFRIIASRDLRLPLGAWDGRGRDVMVDLKAHDGRYVQGFRDLPFKGFAELHAIEIDLGPAPSGAPTRLIMRGLTDYFTANSVYAAYQADVRPVVPYVEVLADGRWVRIADDIGFPAGLARTMTADLTGRIPPDARRIRIWTNLKIHWDQILIDRTIGAPPIRQTEIPLMRASLAFRGFPRETPGEPAADLQYEYNQVSPTGPFTRQVGHYTAYGDIARLLAARDDRFVIFGAGDEVALDFDADALPAMPTGWSRTYLFYADGFAKDMDFHAAAGETVGPLPFHSMPGYPYPPNLGRRLDATYLDYLLNTNIRAVSGREAGRYRFEFEQR